ncbi:hypothetical protein BDB00DRAFT_303074 [Zychaea mexicana]|uniref:uncharacterized protein n=1 Tax=Zychaea mexicana TaxID=64656 RepID=UPI0022FECBBD|nr:uncharacterized protein BDB00DRAFT_303074 [Zychaea mexicana]KAI9467606.1 hypothetical protein BDB00DRAFT_303074 [Zychaea mexicana]
MASIDVVINILKQHTFKSHMLSDKYLEEGSETSLIVKYWGMVFEAYFSYHQDIQLQWGDTSSSIQQVRHLFNLDIRVLATNYTTHIEAATGEVAKVAAVTETKLFQDRLKSVLVSKAHLNSILKKMPNITEDMVKSIQVPIIQALGTTCFVYSMTLIDKKLYTLQEVCDFRYPRTYADLRDGTILLKLLRSLDLVMVRC